MGAFTGKTEVEELTSKVSGTTLTLIRKGNMRQAVLGGKLMVTMADNAKTLYNLDPKDRPRYSISNAITYQHNNANTMPRLAVNATGALDVIVWMPTAPTSAQSVTGSLTWFVDEEV